MAYYDPDAILIDAQKVPFIFQLDVPQLAPLNNGSAVEHGTRLDFPVWLAEICVLSRPAPGSSAFGTIDTPSVLEDRVLNALRADPKSVDVRAQAQWYYDLARRYLELFEDEAMVEVLTEVST
jgi:GINS complex subunit 3